ncbi:hypothetical protein GHT06_015268 [Daphnia sinensis]|uniref:Retropepsins domain-containing protein n=1 Tax=Daphnia sinensis TaxID=1820382 RepID=A0AAD5PSS9_9CRUS|nr:hypothetical protein GHT06_015268 [Daphnia sinensis]
MVSADEDEAEESTVLLIDSSRLITEDVICQGVRVRAVIDTGAMVLVAFPSLQERFQVRATECDGPSVLMVNGQKAPPLGQFKRLQISYAKKDAELLLGELPVNAIIERALSSTRKLVTRTGRTLPRIIVSVEIEPAALKEDT